MQYFSRVADFVQKFLGKYEYVVHVNDNPSLGLLVFEDVVHHSLEGCGGVAHAEKHDSRFK